MPKYRPGIDDDEAPGFEPIRSHANGDELPVDPGVPHGGHNAAYGGRGDALRAARRRAEQTGGEVIHDDAHAPGQRPHYHVQNADGTRQPGHIFHGGPAKRVRKPDRLVTRVQGGVIDRRTKRRFDRESEAEAELEALLDAVHAAVDRVQPPVASKSKPGPTTPTPAPAQKTAARPSGCKPSPARESYAGLAPWWSSGARPRGW